MTGIIQGIWAGRSAFLLVLAGVFWPTVAGVAQTEFSGLPEPGAPVFYADVAVFRGESGPGTTIEIYYKIKNPNLTYVRRGEKYFANYEIDGILRGGGNPQVATATISESYSILSYQETRNHDAYLLNKMEMTAPPGGYKLELTLRDRISNRSFARTLEVRVPKFRADEYSISTPLFCGVAGTLPVPEKFTKHGLAVLPRVSRSYGAMQENVPIYLEVYTPGDTVSELLLIARSFHRYQNHTREDTLRFAPGQSGVTPVLLDISLSEFVPGECQLTLTLTDGMRVLADEVKTVYQVEWSLTSMLGNDWNQVVDQLVHITTHKEHKALRKAPEDKRLEIFNAFWKAKDPSPDTPENEWKNEYYRRIRFADVHYTNPYRRGWQTDFGMVYIKYGEPDQIERYPFELGSKPYEIWYYYAQDRKFIFMDAKGNGDYQLQYPYDGRYRRGG